jgi:hypothetical protein
MLYGLLDNKPSQNPCIAVAPFCTDSSSARHLENRAKIVLKWLPQFLCLEQLYDLLNSYCTDCPLMLKMSWDACLLPPLNSCQSHFAATLSFCSNSLGLSRNTSDSSYSSPSSPQKVRPISPLVLLLLLINE